MGQDVPDPLRTVWDALEGFYGPIRVRWRWLRMRWRR
jgi:hypothetical protein